MDSLFHTESPGFKLPLVISVTGHRDLVDSELDSIRARVEAFLLSLQQQFPEYELLILNPLAEGADQLVARVALELGISYIVPLPKPLQQYRAEMKGENAKEEFDFLLSRATSYGELRNQDSREDEENSPLGTSAAYARLGIYLSSHCHILLAIWDGKATDEIGGTSQVVQFHHDDYMPGMTGKSRFSTRNLVDDESDLVYHIVCSRNRDNGSPPPELLPLDWFWFTKDIEQPLSKKLPEQHIKIFARGADFSSDALRFLDQINANRVSLMPADGVGSLPPGIEDIDYVFSIADWLAIHFKSLTQITLRITHTAAFFMGLMLLLYSDFESHRLFMILFMIFFLAASAAHLVAKHFEWQRKYLDYRTLAEGLRVQFYWACAGISNEAKWRFAHDSYLQSQDPEFGWIRNVMRVAGTHYDLNPAASDDGMGFTIRAWVGSGNKGQLGYYKEVASDNIKRHKTTRVIDRFSLIVSALVILAFLVFDTQLDDLLSTSLFVLMGVALLAFAVRDAFSHATAMKEHIKQYEYMLRIFDSAHRRLNIADSITDKRQILLDLGESALEEHSDWILMHRERSMDQSEIWRMGN